MPRFKERFAQSSQTLAGTDTAWDAYSVPAEHWRSWVNAGPGEALLLLLSAGDHRKTIDWDAQVVAQTAAAGWAIDADGCVAPKYFVDRSQR